MKIHPICEQFPLMPDQELVELAEDIKKHGQQEPGLVLNGMILDGRNRYLACQIAGVEFQWIPYRGNDPVGLVRSANIYRRHLTESQRAFFVAQVCNLQAGVHKSNSSRELAQAEAAKEAGVSVSTVKRAKTVLKKGSDELKNAVKSGKVSVNTAARLTKLPKKEQETVILKGAKEAKRVASKLTERARTLRPFAAYAEVPVVKQSLTAELPAVNGDPVAIVRACYEKHKLEWNNIPPAPPVVVVEAICKALSAYEN